MKSSPQSKKKVIIAIDGPAASGKSTTARLLAKRLGYLYLDTGAMYRALTWKALKDKVDIRDEKTLSKLAKKAQIRLSPRPNLENRIYLDNQEITSFLRSPKVNRYVSQVSTVKRVRDILVSQQRKIGKNGAIVAEGRDITTVVFPYAEVKIFLKASLEERVRRRWKEEKGISSKKKEIAAGLLHRDRIDGQRKTSPLRVSPEAIVIDNTNLTISETVNKIADIVKKSFAQ